MNAKELYLMIGKIDDDLILEAGKIAEKKKKWVIMRFAAAAACICLLTGEGYARYTEQYTVWNQAEAGFMGKAAIPADGTVKTFTKEEGEAYYNISSLPEKLGDELKSTGISFMIIQDASGKAIYDRNLIRYENEDRSKGINLTLSKVSVEEEDNEKMKNSHIRRQSVILTETDLGDGNQLLEAKWEAKGTKFCAAADGMDKKEFFSLLKELIS